MQKKTPKKVNDDMVGRKMNENHWYQYNNKGKKEVFLPKKKLYYMEFQN